MKVPTLSLGFRKVEARLTNVYKICVYAICKNEEKFVDRWMDSVSEADMVVVTDTGSVDGTIERLKSRGAVVYSETIQPWRFDEARNRALSHVPEDIDICVSNDMDEIFEPGWRKKLEEAWKPFYTRARYTFVWSHDSLGNIEKQFPMEKIHRRSGYKWVHPVHEILVFDGAEALLRVPEIVLHHYPDHTKPRSQYLSLLELSALENPENDRVRYWLGREYMLYSHYDAAIKTLLEYLELPSAKWDEERCAAMRNIATCYEHKRDYHKAKEWLYKAIAQCPHVREPYLGMARLGYLTGDWPLTAAMVSEALQIIQKTNSYLQETGAWGADLYDYGSVACFRLGQYAMARQYAMNALRCDPVNERLKRNLDLIEQALASSDSSVQGG